MEQLADYRLKHSQKYQERVELERLEEKRIKDEQDHLEYIISTVIENLINTNNNIISTNSPTEMANILHNGLGVVREYQDVWKTNEVAFMQIKQLVMELLESVNNNLKTVINFSKEEEVIASIGIKDFMKEYLRLTDVIGEEDEELKIEYDMDCSNDENYAKYLETQS
jgi:hypothetical protein